MLSNVFGCELRRLDSLRYVGRRLVGLGNIKLHIIETGGTKLSNRRDRKLVAGKNLTRHSLDVCNGHPIYTLEDFVQRKLASEEYFLSCEIAHPRGGRLETQHDRNFKLIFCSLELCVRHWLALELVEFLDAEPYHIRKLIRRSCGVNRYVSGIGISVDSRKNCVRQAVFFSNRLKQPRAHATAKNYVQDVNRVTIR